MSVVVRAELLAEGGQGRHGGALELVSVAKDVDEPRRRAHPGTGRLGLDQVEVETAPAESRYLARSSR